MRLRNIKGSRELIESSKYIIQNPEEYKGKWSEIFKNNNPVQIEIGMGKGKFITQHAEKYPQINFIGIEKYSSVLLRAIEKRSEMNLNNLFFIRFDAVEIERIFDTNEVDKIFLNFSDPWPKDRHSKRRLTSSVYLERYEKILKKDGIVEFKTDNRELFEFSIDQAKEAGWEIIDSTYDLHKSNMFENNIMTEYEEKFSQLGNNIHKLIIKKKKKD